MDSEQKQGQIARLRAKLAEAQARRDECQKQDGLPGKKLWMTSAADDEINSANMELKKAVGIREQLLQQRAASQKYVSKWNLEKVAEFRASINVARKFEIPQEFFSLRQAQQDACNNLEGIANRATRAIDEISQIDIELARLGE